MGMEKIQGRIVVFWNCGLYTAIKTICLGSFCNCSPRSKPGPISYASSETTRDPFALKLWAQNPLQDAFLSSRKELHTSSQTKNRAAFLKTTWKFGVIDSNFISHRFHGHTCSLIYFYDKLICMVHVNLKWKHGKTHQSHGCYCISIFKTRICWESRMLNSKNHGWSTYPLPTYPCQK